VHFPPGCELPDPYDGLVESLHGQLEVHDCMGCVLRLDEQVWGLLTLDALQPGSFGTVELARLEAFARLAAVIVRTVQRIDQLARQLREQQRDAEQWRAVAGGQPEAEMIGQSTAYKTLRRELRLVGPSELGVLISGETGVGKELVARQIHRLSARAERPLVVINCAALPDTLVESELFGHVRGAFTGAVGDRRGRFELADGGSLFLDEVGELPLPVQAKLLRVLQSGQLQRVGSDREHHVDVRVIAATNRDLASEVRAGRFRADLYHRLGAYPLRVPPLRERERDVLLLAGSFLEQARGRLGLRGLRLTDDARQALLGYDWPGNVRELEHLIGRAVLRAQAQGSEGARRILSVDARALDLPLPVAVSGAGAALASPETAGSPVIAGPGQGLKQALDDFQRGHIAAVLQRHDGNWAACARELEVDRANLHRLARRLGLK
jgi:anaerobic nitric oxide reductase transcription regulator